ncbi:hypothetical protein FSP39_025262 [Pinctada imbricata]|uniref:Uncharacterized protein n=1 Tax=Pinctada imbricata TaxID=66713 RepID=A0AA88Y1R1_PINIB|nr:hypothetical protein FSP39_025262 [Pinctada imbricata]
MYIFTVIANTHIEKKKSFKIKNNFDSVLWYRWLDKLGLAAKSNVGGLMRQTFIQGSYALVDPDTLYPNPDYWLTVLYKRLVGNIVYNAQAYNATNKIRLYAHSANTNWYSSSCVVLYGMNLYKENVTLELPQYKNLALDLYLLQAPNSDLYSRSVLLNGNRLHLNPDDTLPNLNIPVQVKDNFTLPPYSYFFLVIPTA